MIFKINNNDNKLVACLSAPLLAISIDLAQKSVDSYFNMGN